MRDGDLARIDALLAAWGRWAVSDRYGLGYPRRNIIDRIMHQGVVGASIRRPYNSPLPTPGTDIERCERAVSLLPPHLRVVVVEKYTCGGPREQDHASHIGLTLNVWRLRQTCAWHWLLGRLSR